jgi:hypothetical protein
MAFWLRDKYNSKQKAVSDTMKIVYFPMCMQTFLRWKPVSKVDDQHPMVLLPMTLLVIMWPNEVIQLSGNETLQHLQVIDLKLQSPTANRKIV